MLDIILHFPYQPSILIIHKSNFDTSQSWMCHRRRLWCKCCAPMRTSTTTLSHGHVSMVSALNQFSIYEWMNECVFIYSTYHMMSHGGLQCYWVRSNVSLWRRPWLPLSVHFWSHSPTQPMHEMWDRPLHREHRPLLFPTSAWVL